MHTQRTFLGRGRGAAISFASVALFILLWHVGGRLELFSPLLLPPPGEVLDSALEIAVRGYRQLPLWHHLAVSLGRVFAAFIPAVLIGVPVGLAMGLFPVLRAIVEPFVQFFRPLPKLALIPLVILWLGIGEVSKIFLIFISALLTILVGCAASASGTDQSRLRLGRALGATDSQLLRYIILPGVLPEVFTSIRLATGVGWTTLIAAEMVAADAGIGWMVLNASSYMRTDIVMLGIILLGGTGYILDLLIVALQRLTVPWDGKA
ncbi:MAG: ABC transporter permease subunit [Deltaproteobacteria bacterium]|jgi:taurine transport system permease protein|nr:ABC transporter permease subunit [Deltaproteobacteria bacterium]